MKYPVNGRESLRTCMFIIETVYLLRKYHEIEVSPKNITSYSSGDEIRIKAYSLSQAYYGLSKKFLSKYTEEYLVSRDLATYVYVMVLIRNEARSSEELLINVRQMIFFAENFK